MATIVCVLCVVECDGCDFDLNSPYAAHTFASLFILLSLSFHEFCLALSFCIIFVILF